MIINRIPAGENFLRKAAFENMSGSEDDWEKQLEDEAALDKNLQAAKKKKFEDEDAIDSEEERKKSKEEQKTQPESGKKKKT